MPLFDISTALSGELKAAYQLADRLADLTAVQNLAETNDDDVARLSITVGIAGDPFEGEGYTVEELENRHFVIRIYGETDEGHVAGQSSEVAGGAREVMQFKLYIRRQVRESEDRTDAYNFFWDRISNIGLGLIGQNHPPIYTPRTYEVTQVSRVIGPDFGERRGEGPQGAFLLAMFQVTLDEISRG